MPPQQCFPYNCCKYEEDFNDSQGNVYVVGAENDSRRQFAPLLAVVMLLCVCSDWM